MAKKRTAQQFLDDAEVDGLVPLPKASVNGDKALKHLEDGTQINYNRMLGLWDEYEKRNPGIKHYNIKSAKHFIKAVARSCKARKEALSIYTVIQKWIDFGAGWKRRPGNMKIPHEMSKTVHFYVQDELRKKLSLSTARRTRHYMTVHHFVILITHMWQRNWHQYKHRRIQVQDHTAYILFIYSSGRVGEDFESSIRKASGRGLLYETIDFIIFRNEKGAAEIGVQVERDAKGFSDTLQERPRYGMYEDMEPLYANPVLPLLAVALTDGTFKDYESFQEIEAIPPPTQGSLCYFRIKDEMRRLPFF